MNRSLSSYRHFPQSIKQALKAIGEFSKHDRVNIIEIHNDMTFRIAYEWCDKDTVPTPEKWKQAHLFYHSALEKQLCTQNHIIIRNENPADPEIQTLLEEQHCRQMLLLPLFESGSSLAFLSFVQCHDSHEWSGEEIRTLSQLSSMVATRLNNYLLFHRLLFHLKKYHEQNVSFLLQYARLKNIRTALTRTREKIADNTSGLPEWTEIEKHISNLDKICQALTEK
ncbi:MAG: hypothetical protein K2L23_02755 [Odoribacter sp.]|nr:hypothetical protein [Odoribacter sp.]